MDKILKWEKRGRGPSMLVGEGAVLAAQAWKVKGCWYWECVNAKGGYMMGGHSDSLPAAKAVAEKAVRDSGHWDGWAIESSAPPEPDLETCDGVVYCTPTCSMSTKCVGRYECSATGKWTRTGEVCPVWARDMAKELAECNRLKALAETRLVAVEQSAEDNHEGVVRLSEELAECKAKLAAIRAALGEE